MTIKAAGADINGSADEFTFVYQEASGDLDVKVRLDSLTRVNSWTVAGLMVRETNRVGAKHAAVLVSSGSGAALRWRPRRNRETSQTRVGGFAAPAWVRLVRTGNTFQAFASADGSKWTPVGTALVKMDAAVEVGLAVASHSKSAATTASFSGFRSGDSGSGAEEDASAAALPSPWRSRDVGSSSPKGQSKYSSGTFTVIGGGADIGGTTDQFQFAYQAVSGDTQIVARVASLAAANAWSRAGVVIRDATSAKSAYVGLFASGTSSNGWVFQHRDVYGGTTSISVANSGVAPGWVRLVREGKLFSAYMSTDGSSWELVGTTTVTMDSTTYVGLAVGSRDRSKTATGTFSSVVVGKPSSTNTAPSVSITSPSSGSSFATGKAIAIAASATDVDGSVAAVDFYVGSTKISTDSSSPYTTSWTPSSAGSYTLKAVATDNGGMKTTSSSVSVSVGSTNNPPAVSLTSPSSGASFTAPATIAITASASDSDGSISKVDFYAGGTLIGSDSSSPYSVSWSSVPAGSYNLTAVATDNSGAKTTSASISITVSTSTTTKPTTLMFTPPSDYSSNVTSVVVELRKGGTSATTTPVATKNLGKPSAGSGGDVSADISSIVDPLASGTYYAIVVTKNSSGSTPSSPSPTFTK
jgi:regulation of enolase protein 1 (concanavalin A-like superfamily)